MARLETTALGTWRRGALVATLAVAVLLAGPAAGAPSDRPVPPPGTAPVYAAGRILPVEGAWSVLVRAPTGLVMAVHAVGLVPDHAYAAWWTVFNVPEFCTHPVATTGARCGAGDLPTTEGDPRVEATMSYATGHVVEAGSAETGVRTTDFVAWLPVATWGGAVFGPGLLDPAGAEVQLVLTDLGPSDSALDAYQIRALADRCKVGTPSCPVAQISVQLP